MHPTYILWLQRSDIRQHGCMLIEHAPRWQQFHVAGAMTTKQRRGIAYIKKEEKKKKMCVKLQSLDHSQLHTKGIAQC